MVTGWGWLSWSPLSLPSPTSLSFGPCLLVLLSSTHCICISSSSFSWDHESRRLLDMVELQWTISLQEDGDRHNIIISGAPDKDIYPFSVFFFFFPKKTQKTKNPTIYRYIKNPDLAFEISILRGCGHPSDCSQSPPEADDSWATLLWPGQLALVLFFKEQFPFLCFSFFFKHKEMRSIGI